MTEKVLIPLRFAVGTGRMCSSQLCYRIPALHAEKHATQRDRLKLEHNKTDLGDGKSRFLVETVVKSVKGTITIVITFEH